jgi:integrative and conjugative element protein (TIGR02256 family)
MLLESPWGGPTASVLIEDEVLNRVSPFRQLKADAPEAGGIFLGYRRGEHIHVVDATVPAPKDICSRYSFIRQDPIHQTEATQGWQRSDGRLGYLGDWHTHPEPQPSPSSLDLHEWRKLCRSQQDVMLFAILGTRDWWFGAGRGSRITRAYKR